MSSKHFLNQKGSYTDYTVALSCIPPFAFRTASIHRGISHGYWPVLTPVLPTVIKLVGFPLGGGTFLIHTETVEHDKPSRVAVLDTSRCAWHLLPYPVQRQQQKIVLPIHPLNGTHTQSMSQNPSLTHLLPLTYTNESGFNK